MTGPLYVYYSLENFYQNHRLYVSSVDSYQLAGDKRKKSDLESTCNSKVTDGSQLLNPCGLIANSYFTGMYMCLGICDSLLFDISHFT